ncbi:unnamed protein product [Cyprideis torosa]|uniref:Uncharacterized protein n=1 Tax=Cyprideis torosa TaxID=163714 RepID=A0A7R8ZRT0_9CRUS|nr:unnamed protein product [Cyprideis torosa]CAG0899799.1 unnamed protein product [Cyprideis torosa]
MYSSPFSIPLTQDQKAASIAGLRGSAAALFLGQLAKQRPCCCILPDEHLVAPMAWDLKIFTHAQILTYPGYEIPPYTPLSPDQNTTATRLATLYALQENGSNSILITSVEALLRRVIPRRVLLDRAELILAQEEIDKDDLVDQLQSSGYEKVSLVRGVGDFSVRGGIVDIYPPDFIREDQRLHHGPLRLDFFGDLLESLRSFDPSTQRSHAELTEALILPASDILHKKGQNTPSAQTLKAFREEADKEGWDQESAAWIFERLEQFGRFAGAEFFLPLFYSDEERCTDTVFDYLPRNCALVLVDPSGCQQAIDLAHQRIISNHEEVVQKNKAALAPDHIFLSPDSFRQKTAKFQALQLTDFADETSALPWEKTTDHRLIKQDIALHRRQRGIFAPLIDRLVQWQKENHTIILCCRSPKHGKNLADILCKRGFTIEQVFPPLPLTPPPPPGPIYICDQPLQHGFSLLDRRIHILSESELFGEMRQGARTQKREKSKDVLQFAELNHNDIVVHRDHGLAIYQGLVTLELQGVQNDFMLLEYRDGDKLYLPVDRLNLVTRYEGLSDKKPRIDKLGSQAWKTTTNKIKEEVWKVALELLDIYAQREMQTGRSFSAPEAIAREMRRDGQVFFVHNRIQSIHKIADRIQKLVPSARIAVAHGQMAGKQLEDIMVQFVQKEIDVLVSTTIIESGLDIPAANTILINRADKLGLAEIYQLRGRVGRSSTQSFAYLLVPSMDALSKDAKERLRALMDYNELGGGFKLAMSDLQIRGGGNILGISQSGHIAAIGYDLYLELLQRTVSDLKAQGLADRKGVVLENIDPEINLNISAYVPHNYIEDIGQRYIAYRRISVLASEDEEQFTDLREELIDRYGPLPRETENLFAIMALKKALIQLRIEKLERGRDTLVFTFAQDTPAGKTVFLVTNAHPKTLEIKLNKANIAGYFDTMVCSEEIGLAKEERAFWEKLGQRLDFTPSRTMLADDTKKVLAAAGEYGIAHLVHIAKPSSRQPLLRAEDFFSIAAFDEILPEKCLSQRKDFSRTSSEKNQEASASQRIAFYPEAPSTQDIGTLAIAAMHKPDFLALPLMLTSDNHLVVSSTLTLEKHCNVARIFPDRAREDGRFYLADFTLQELQQLLFSAPEKSLHGGTTVHLMTFSDALAFLQALKLQFNLAPKPIAIIQYPWFYHHEGKDISSAIIGALRTSQQTEESQYVMCFDPDELKYINKELLQEADRTIKIIQAVDSPDGSEALRQKGTTWLPYDYQWLLTRIGLRVVSGYADILWLHSPDDMDGEAIDYVLLATRDLPLEIAINIDSAATPLLEALPREVGSKVILAGPDLFRLLEWKNNSQENRIKMSVQDVRTEKSPVGNTLIPPENLR